MAGIQEHRDQTDEAMATYLEIADRYRGQPRAPEAMFRVADLMLRSKRPDRALQARRLFTTLANEYAQTAWAPRALLAKAAIEDRAT